MTHGKSAKVFSAEIRKSEISGKIEVTGKDFTMDKVRHNLYSIILKVITVYLRVRSSWL